MRRSSEHDKTVPWALTLFTLLVFSIRTWLASSLDLSPDEAYYWRWSLDLQFSYPDHPPLIAWLIRLGTLIAGNSTIGVRLPGIIISCVGIWIIYWTALAAGLNKTSSALASAIATALPIVSVGALIATADTPLGLCWMLTGLGLIKLSRYDSSKYWWYLLGIAAGIGLLAKLTALMIVPIVLACAFFVRPIRQDLKTRHPYLAGALAFLIALPWLVSQSQNGFASFVFQFAHLSGNLEMGDSTIIERTSGLIAGQIGLITPPVALLALCNIRRNAISQILAILFGVPFLATFIAAFFTHPEQNWAALGHPSLALGAVLAMSDKSKRWTITTIATVGAFCFLIHLHAVKPFLGLPPKRDPVSRLHGWDHLEKLRMQVAQADAIICDNYGIASQFAWHFREDEKNKFITSTDRPFTSPPPGNWLIVDEALDWGSGHLSVECKKQRLSQKLSMKRKDSTTVRTVDVFIGTECSLKK